MCIKSQGALLLLSRLSLVLKTKTVDLLTLAGGFNMMKVKELLSSTVYCIGLLMRNLEFLANVSISLGDHTSTCILVSVKLSVMGMFESV
jgi:hypothetical protein